MIQVLQRPTQSTESTLPKRQQALFTTVRSEGAMLPVDLLQRIALNDASLPGLTPADYHLFEGEKLNEAINRSWNRLLGGWASFQWARKKLPDSDSGTRMTRERWLLPLFRELGYSWLAPAAPIEVGEQCFPISHGYHRTPIQLVSCTLDLDHLERQQGEAKRRSPYSLVQETLNRSDKHLWGLVSNGLSLRLLRDNVSMTRQAYVEFDLETMLDNEVYADFVLFWLLCHQSRIEAEKPEDCWLEEWSKLAREQGKRALDQLRDGVEKAISALGRGFLRYSRNGAPNQELRQKLESGTLKTQDYYRQLLRLVYRLLVLFVAEDRDVLFHPEAPALVRTRYAEFYSTARLRRLADKRIGTEHADLFHTLRMVMETMSGEQAHSELGLTALNGYLFSKEALADLNGCEIANHDLLDAIRALAFIRDGQIRRVVDYRNLGSEELGSVYESLLELHPLLNTKEGTFVLATASGNERKTTGSYYTPTSLISSLLDSALDPVLEEACRQPDPVQALLDLKVCDPACGSGHFLIAAGHRIARKLASIRTGLEEPAPEEQRKALREVVGRCLYGVDINPMSVELCKVSLWMEAIEPGKPLSFLDAHIQEGNSLLGATPALLKIGIPTSAFEPIEGDDRKVCSALKKLNEKERSGQLYLLEPESYPWQKQGNLAASMMKLEQMSDQTIADIRQKQEAYECYVKSGDYLNGKLWADAWCAAFVWKKTNEFSFHLTEKYFREIEENPHKLTPWMRDEIIRLAKHYKFFHWHLAFSDVFRTPAQGEEPENLQAGWSGGFDVVLGNPPWEHTELKEQEWFASRSPDIADAAGAVRKKMIKNLAMTNPDLYKDFSEAKRQEDGWSHFIRQSGHYPLCGRGRINTYAIFAEDMRTLIASKGRMGCVVPSGLATDDTTKFFFSDMVESRSLVSFYIFENEVRLFPEVDHRVRFALLAVGGIALNVVTSDFVFGAYHTEDLYEQERHFALSAADIKLLNPNTKTLPIFRSKRDMMITKSVYAHVPVLLKEGTDEQNCWNISFRQGLFNMTSDSHLFLLGDQLITAGWELIGNTFYRNGEKCFPLYEGKMIWHFDHRFGTYEGQTQAQANQGKLPELTEEQHRDPTLSPLPRYWVHESHLPDITRDGREAFIAFRDIVNSVLFRTAIFSIIPVVPCGHKLPIILLDPKSHNELIYLNTCFSSFPFDYITRQKLGGISMSYFILKQLPVLSPELYKATCEWDHHLTIGNWILPRAMELTYTAWDLAAFAEDCGYGGAPFRWDDERRFLLRCELDAAYFHLYGIGREDVDYIMETFPIVKRKDEKLYGEYRTKRVILEMYDQMQEANITSETFVSWLVPGPADDAVRHLNTIHPFM